MQVSDYMRLARFGPGTSYYSLHVDGETNVDSAWYYPAPKEKAEEIRNHVAFWKGVQVTG